MTNGRYDGRTDRQTGVAVCALYHIIFFLYFGYLNIKQRLRNSIVQVQRAAIIYYNNDNNEKYHNNNARWR